MIFATRDINEEEEFLITYIVKVTKMNYFFTDSEEFRKELRVMIESQFQHDLYNKSSSNLLESDDEIGTLQRRIKWWMTVVHRGGLTPNDL